jgi:hypothetical protein
LTFEEIDFYLENRRAKGFSVIQVMVLPELDGLNTPNRYGLTPLINNNPETPNEAYFDFVDKVVKMAGDKGIFMGLVPTWGDKVDKQAWGIGPVVFNSHNIAFYGRWLANRYKDFYNIIWINGGDRAGGVSPRDAADGRVVDPEVFNIWTALGEAIKSTDPNHLVTYHPWDKNPSSFWFHESKWLDFNMFQSGHLQRNCPNYELIAADYGKLPVKPCMDAEPCYEEHCINFDPSNGWFDDFEVRQAAWWAILAGALGHTYGCHNIWQFLDAGRMPISHARRNWQESLDLPGAVQMKYLKEFFESKPFTELIPDQELILTDSQKIRAARIRNSIIVYTPYGEGFKVNLGKLEKGKFKASWFNPRNNKTSEIGIFDNQSIIEIQSQPDGMDWVVVIEKI